MADADAMGNTRKAYSVIKRLIGVKRATSDMKDKSEKVVTEMGQKLKEWAKDFKKFLKRPARPRKIESNAAPPFTPFSKDNPCESGLLYAIHKLRSNKTAGDENIPPELFIHDKNLKLKALYCLLQKVRNTEEMPKEWKNCNHLSAKNRRINRMEEESGRIQ